MWRVSREHMIAPLFVFCCFFFFFFFGGGGEGAFHVCVSYISELSNV